jgi:hypothetical protein
VHVRPARPPAALLPAPLARTVGFALLALLGAAEWMRMVGHGSLLGALPWVLAAVLVGETVGAASSLPPRLRAPSAALAAALGLVLAALASGLEPRLLAPAHWTELGDGVGRGLEALSGVTLPYAGVDPWPDVTMRLGGALLVALAAVLATWPRRESRGFPFFALAALLVLVATPVTAIGTSRSLVLGVALAALTVCFLWLERLPLRPGVGVAVLGGVALAGALPLSAAANRDGPWFDYSSWAEGLGTPASVRFSWDHSYGPLHWNQDGREMLRIRSGRPQYWKLENLDEFDGEHWVMRGDPAAAGPDPDADLDENWTSHPQWTGEARVTVRGLRAAQLAGAGTTLAVDAGSHRALGTFSPGTFVADDELKAGDSYTVRFHAPRPSPIELAASSSGTHGEQSGARQVQLPLLRPELPPAGNLRARPVTALRFEFPAFAAPGGPVAHNDRHGTVEPGLPAVRNTPYWRVYRLAQRLKRGARTPYEFVRRVDFYLDRGFRYDQRPSPPPPGVPALEDFLFKSKAGYCQHFSGAMALLLRFGGVPARVATGFSPGGFSRRQQEWVIRDRDAHSWVEAWFDGVGWVTFDPTPTATPARSLIAAIAAPRAANGDPAGRTRAGAVPPSTRNPAGARRDLDQPVAPAGRSASERDGRAPVWELVAIALALLVAIGALGLWWRRREASAPMEPADRAIADLVVALRRAGRPVPPGVTLSELERRLGGSRGGASYLAALRAARYGPAPDAPTPNQRRAFRRELAAGLGWRGALRAWWALPPQRPR